MPPIFHLVDCPHVLAKCLPNRNFGLLKLSKECQICMCYIHTFCIPIAIRLCALCLDDMTVKSDFNLHKFYICFSQLIWILWEKRTEQNRQFQVDHCRLLGLAHWISFWVQNVERREYVRFNISSLVFY